MFPGLLYQSIMPDIDKWVDIAKDCKYLPENDLKVNFLYVFCEVFPLGSLCVKRFKIF